MRKSLKVILVLCVALLFSNYVFASTVSKSDATMKLVKDEVCDISFGTYGSFKKKMSKIDIENKTIDIDLTVTNNDDGNHTHEETSSKDVAGEVVLLIDSSDSMTISKNNITINNRTYTRKELVMDAADKLVDQLFAGNPDIKIGVVEFARAVTTMENPTRAGTDADAKTITPTLTSNKEEVKSALNTVKEDNMGSTTDIDIGLKAANALMQTSTNPDAKKFIVLLTDGVPNVSEGTEEKYSEEASNATKERLTSIKNNGINIISLLIDIAAEPVGVNSSYPDGTTALEIAQQVFGTQDNPFIGSVYYAETEGVSSTVSNEIYKELIPIVTTTTVDDSDQYKLTDIVIKDYIPQNIVDNFEFSLLTKPDRGTVTDTVDTSDNSITWTIPELEPGKTSTFTYRLKLKNTFSGDIVGINLPTNKDVTIDYKENGKPGEQKHNDKCPVVALDVLAPKIIPKTGSNTWLAIAGVSLAGVAISIFGIIKFKKLRK